MLAEEGPETTEDRDDWSGKVELEDYEAPARAILKKRYVAEHELTTYPEEEEVKADMGAEAYEEAVSQLAQELEENLNQTT